LLTGSTGFLGNAVLTLLLQRHPTATFCLLIRARKTRTAHERGYSMLSKLSEQLKLTAEEMQDRVRIVEGSIEDSMLWIRSDFVELQHQLTHIIHCAATVNNTP
jgi:thioester reductase-like protein